MLNKRGTLFLGKPPAFDQLGDDLGLDFSEWHEI
jgi:hypothetical protein